MNRQYSLPTYGGEIIVFWFITESDIVSHSPKPCCGGLDFPPKCLVVLGIANGGRDPANRLCKHSFHVVSDPNPLAGLVNKSCERIDRTSLSLLSRPVRHAKRAGPDTKCVGGDGVVLAKKTRSPARRAGWGLVARRLPDVTIHKRSPGYGRGLSIGVVRTSRKKFSSSRRCSPVAVWTMTARLLPSL